MARGHTQKVLQMKLVNSSMVFLSALLLIGCRQTSTLQQFEDRIKSTQAFRATIEMKTRSGRIETLEVLRSLPHRLLITSKNYSLTVNEIDGILELGQQDKQYDLIDWRGEFQPGTGKIMPPEMIFSGPFSGMSVSKFAPLKSWKNLRKADGTETWQAEYQTQEGPQKANFTVKNDGTPITFETAGLSYQSKNFEFLPEQPIEKFRLPIPDGFIPIQSPIEVGEIRAGSVLELSGLENTVELRQKGLTLVGVFDGEPVSEKALKAFLQIERKATKITIIRGAKRSGLSALNDPDGKIVDTWTDSFPAFYLVNGKGQVLALWQGFDAENPKKQSEEIDIAIRENS
jgi:hypothetical protein